MVRALTILASSLSVFAQWLAEPPIFLQRFLTFSIPVAGHLASGQLRAAAATSLGWGYPMIAATLWWSRLWHVDSASLLAGFLFPVDFPNGRAYVLLSHKSYHALDTTSPNAPRSDDGLALVFTDESSSAYLTFGWGHRSRWWGETTGRINIAFLEFVPRVWWCTAYALASLRLAVRAANGMVFAVESVYYHPNARKGITVQFALEGQ